MSTAGFAAILPQFGLDSSPSPPVGDLQTPNSPG